MNYAVYFRRKDGEGETLRGGFFLTEENAKFIASYLNSAASSDWYFWAVPQSEEENA